ncbi:MAG: hypothetical protein RJQ08_05020 [Salinisphaeraceae bacterium]
MADMDTLKSRAVRDVSLILMAYAVGPDIGTDENGLFDEIEEQVSAKFIPCPSNTDATDGFRLRSSNEVALPGVEDAPCIPGDIGLLEDVEGFDVVLQVAMPPTDDGFGCDAVVVRTPHDGVVSFLLVRGQNDAFACNRIDKMVWLDAQKNPRRALAVMKERLRVRLSDYRARAMSVIEAA